MIIINGEIIQMKFDDLETRMRQFEESDRIPTEFHLVIRADGHSFHKLTRRYSKPFSYTFHKTMINTVENFMKSHIFTIPYAYTHSDEMSFYIAIRDIAFNRKIRKFLSITAGHISSFFSMYSGDLAAFDARISLLPNEEAVIDYFRWRQADSERNSLNSICHHILLGQKLTASQAAAKTHKMSNEEKHNIIYMAGGNFDAYPDWQKRGTAIFWEKYDKTGYNPIVNESVVVTRRRTTHETPPIGDKCSEFLRRHIFDE